MKISILILGFVCCFALASASESMKHVRMFFGAKQRLAKLDKKVLEDVDVDANAHCLAGRCDCEDEPLLRAYVGTMGNILANCDILQVLATVQTSDERLPKVELLVDVCKILQGISGDLLDDVEAEVDINTCCDVRESLLSLECLNVYLSLAELDLVRAVAASNDLVSGQPTCRQRTTKPVIGI